MLYIETYLNSLSVECRTVVSHTFEQIHSRSPITQLTSFEIEEVQCGGPI